MKFYITYVCTECGWSFGPTRKKIAKAQADAHVLDHIEALTSGGWE